MERELDTGMAEVEMEEKVPRFVDTRGETTPDEIMELLPPQPVTQVLTDPKDPEYGTEGPTRNEETVDSMPPEVRFVAGVLYLQSPLPLPLPLPFPMTIPDARAPL